MTATSKVWFITGCSSGFGNELAHAVLESGARAVLTARNIASIQDLAVRHGERCLLQPLDVTRQADIASAVHAAQERFGAIDVLVNNAGEGFVTAIEAAQEADIRAHFELNYFAPVNLVRAVLPAMRARGSGFIVNMSSVSGLLGRAGSGYYNSTKFALEGFSEALALEVRSFGLKVLIVEPSGFRTRFFEAARQGSAGAYQQEVGRRLQQMQAGQVRVPGNPRHAALAIIAAVESPSPALRLPLGRGAVDAMRSKIALLERDLRAGEEVATAADDPQDE